MAEKDDLLACLVEQRHSLIHKLEALTEDQAARVVVASGWSALDMAYHVTRGERYWVDAIMRGDDVEFDVEDVLGGWAWDTPPGLSYGRAIGEYRQRAATSDAVIASLVSLDDPPGRQPVWEFVRHWSRSNRTVILHLIDETARHAGHLDVHCEILLAR